MTTTSSIRVPGEQTPAWLGASLLAVGLASWVGAGAVAQAQPSAEVVPTREQPGPATVTSAPQEQVEQVEQVLRPGEPSDDPVVILDRPEPGREAEPCAPVVELRFAHGATGVADAEALRKIVKAADAFETRRIVVEGYASAAGPSHRNLQLSHRRARRAKAKLVAQGIDPQRITVQAFGEYRPNLGGDENRDRRVVVKIQGISSCPSRDQGQGQGQHAEEVAQ